MNNLFAFICPSQNGGTNIQKKWECQFSANSSAEEQNKFRSTLWRRSLKKAVLKNCAIFTGKHLCWSLFFNKVVGM